jgi:hypothetical protein
MVAGATLARRKVGNPGRQYQIRPRILDDTIMRPNKALKPTTNQVRGMFAAELGR